MLTHSLSLSTHSLPLFLSIIFSNLSLYDFPPSSILSLIFNEREREYNIWCSSFVSSYTGLRKILSHFHYSDSNHTIIKCLFHSHCVSQLLSLSLNQVFQSNPPPTCLSHSFLLSLTQFHYSSTSLFCCFIQRLMIPEPVIVSLS